MMDVRAARLEMARVTCSLRAEMGGRLTRPVSNQQDRGETDGGRERRLAAGPPAAL